MQFLYVLVSHQEFCDELYDKDYHQALMLKNQKAYTELSSEPQSAFGTVYWPLTHAFLIDKKQFPFYHLLRVFYLIGIRYSTANSLAMNKMLFEFPVAIQQMLTVNLSLQFRNGAVQNKTVKQFVDIIAHAYSPNNVKTFDGFFKWSKAMHCIIGAHYNIDNEQQNFVTEKAH